MTRPYHSNNSARIIPLDNPARYDDAVLMHKLGALIAEAQNRPHLHKDLNSLCAGTVEDNNLYALGLIPGQLDLAGLVPADRA